MSVCFDAWFLRPTTLPSSAGGVTQLDTFRGSQKRIGPVGPHHLLLYHIFFRFPRVSSLTNLTTSNNQQHYAGRMVECTLLR